MTSTDNETQPMSENLNTLTHGLVSHHYQGGSCSPVLIVKFNDSGDSTILWPKDGLPKEFDKDGLWLKFNYLPLRMPSPEACPGVQPVTLSDIQKK